MKLLPVSTPPLGARPPFLVALLLTLIAASPLPAQVALVFQQQPEDVVVNERFTQVVTVHAVDAQGNPVDSFDEDIEVALEPNPGALGGRKTVEADDGVAEFDNLSINEVGTGYTLTASAASLPSTISNSFNVLADSASPATSTIEAVPDSIPADGTSSSTITVQLKDASGESLTTGGDTVNLVSTAGTLSPNPATDNNDGTYTATLTSSTTAETATISGTVNGDAITDTDTVTFTAVAPTPSPATSTITANPTSIPADGTSTSTITVQLKDAGGVNLTTGGDTVTVSTTAGSLGPVTDNDDGTYTATLTSSTTPATATISGTVNGDAITDTATVTFTAVAPTPSPATSTITANPTSIPANGTSTSTITVQLKDASGNNLTTGGDTVTLSTNRGTLVGPVTDSADGTYTATLRSSTTVGTATVSGSVNGQPIVDNAIVSFTVGSVSRLEFQVQPTNTEAGAAITPPVTVHAADAGNNSVSGIQITMSIASGPGSLSGTTTATTDASGIASFGNLVINVAGTYTLRATAGSVQSAPSASFTITPGPPSGATSTITAAPTVITADGTSTSTITVQLKDQFGNNLTAGGATVNLSTTAGALSPNPAPHAGNGQYTATLRSTTTSQTATVTGTVNGQAIADNATVTFAAGSASRLQFQVQPTNTTAGAAITPPVIVRVVDGNGNPVAFTGNITLTIGSNPGGGVLSGTTTRQAVAGVATFGDLSIDKSGAGYTLVAEATGLVGATSTAFTITPGSPSDATSTITADPTTIPANGTSTSTITVQLKDQFGNNLTSGGADVDLSTGGGALSAVTDNGDGTYTATLRSSTVSQTVTVSGSVNGQGLSDTAQVTFTSGSANSLDILVQPSATPLGQSIAPPIRVRVIDAGGNTVTGFNGNITVVLSASPAGGTLSGTFTQPATDGVATFGNLSINRAGNGYVLTFSSPGINSVASTSFSITAGGGSPSTTTITANPTAIPADGSSTSTITVQVKDAGGNNVTAGGDEIGLATTAGTFGPITDRGDGTYTAVLTSTDAPATATITGTLNGAPIADNATVAFASGATDLEVAVEVSNEAPAPGETVVYTVTVRNRGPDVATGVEITDDLPGRLTILSAEASQGSYDGPSGVWRVGRLANGESATLEITVRVNVSPGG